MAINKLYISHRDYNFSKLESKWLTFENLNVAINSDTIEDYHTSIEDCGLKSWEIEEKLLSKCKSIELIGFKLSDSWDLSEEPYYDLIITLSERFKRNSIGWEDSIPNLEKFISNYIRTYRTTDDPVLWVAGCSMSSATGVNKEERWGHLVSKHFNLPEVNIAMPGGSIWDAHDQILRADIRKGDTVIWGLTCADRVDVIVDHRLRPYPSHQYLELDNNYFNIDYLGSYTQYLIAVRDILQVVNYCNKIDAKLYLVNFMDPEFFNKVLGSKSIYLELSFHSVYEKGWIDIGTDGVHPGPLQHKEFAEEIIKFIQGK